MADVTLAVEEVTPDGLEAAYTAIDNADTYFVDRKSGRLLLHFKNTDASIATITFDVTKTRDGVEYTDPTVSVPATSGEVFVGDLGAVFDATGDDEVKFTCDLASGVSVAALDR